MQALTASAAVDKLKRLKPFNQKIKGSLKWRRQNLVEASLKFLGFYQKPTILEFLDFIMITKIFSNYSDCVSIAGIHNLAKVWFM